MHSLFPTPSREIRETLPVCHLTSHKHKLRQQTFMNRHPGPLDAVALKFILQTGESSPEKQRLALNVLTSRLNGSINGVQALEQCYAILGTMHPAQKINAIIDTPMEPIAYRHGREEILSPKSSRCKARNWVPYEDQRLLAGVWQFGLNNWPLVARFVGNGRTRNQCSQRWNRGLNPVLFKGPWTEEEDEKLVALVKKFGEKSWKRIASVLGNRSDVQCRYHFQQIQKKEDGGEARQEVSPTEQSPPKPEVEEEDGLFDLKADKVWQPWFERDFAGQSVLY